MLRKYQENAPIPTCSDIRHNFSNIHCCKKQELSVYNAVVPWHLKQKIKTWSDSYSCPNLLTWNSWFAPLGDDDCKHSFHGVCTWLHLRFWFIPLISMFRFHLSTHHRSVWVFAKKIKIRVTAGTLPFIQCQGEMDYILFQLKLLLLAKLGDICMNYSWDPCDPCAGKRGMNWQDTNKLQPTSHCLSKTSS